MVEVLDDRQAHDSDGPDGHGDNQDVDVHVLVLVLRVGYRVAWDNAHDNPAVVANHSSDLTHLVYHVFLTGPHYSCPLDPL